MGIAAFQAIVRAGGAHTCDPAAHTLPSRRLRVGRPVSVQQDQPAGRLSTS